eukprot:CFRG0170T1
MASTSDPLQLLRKYVQQKKKIEVTADEFIFGDLGASRKAETNYRGKGGTFYNLETIWFLMEKASLSHARYIMECKKMDVPVVTLQDKKPLLSYMNNPDEESASVDDTHFGGIVQTRTAREIQQMQSTTQVQAHAEHNKDGKSESHESTLSQQNKKMDEEKRRHAERIDSGMIASEGSKTIRTKDLTALSDKLGVDKMAEIRAMRLAKKRSLINDVGPESGRKLKEAAPKLMDSAAGGSGFIEADSDMTRQITARERPLRTRESVLITKRKKFDHIFKLLTATKNKEAAAKAAKEKEDQEMGQAACGQLNVSGKRSLTYNRYEVKESEFWKERGTDAGEFDLDTTGGFLSSKRNKTQGVPRQFSSGALDNDGKTKRAVPKPQVAVMSERQIKDASIPIIIVPSAPTAVLSIFNAGDFLENGRFVPSADRKAKMNGKRPSYMIMNRNIAGKKIIYHIFDNTSNFTQYEWKRVVAVFVHGAKWQFKGWPWNGDPTDIFGHIFGAYLRIDSAELGGSLQDWSVTVLDISKERRWLDKTAHRMFWQGLDAWLENPAFAKIVSK